MNKNGDILSPPENRICNVCHGQFTAFFSLSFICGKCLGKIEREKQKAKRLEAKKQKLEERENFDEEVDVLEEIELEPTRHCHDCGTPTSNYRCDACWRKWKIKYGIPFENQQERNGLDD